VVKEKWKKSFGVIFAGLICAGHLKTSAKHRVIRSKHPLPVPSIPKPASSIQSTWRAAVVQIYAVLFCSWQECHEHAPSTFNAGIT
jgi:hypothetical protein